MIQSAQRGDGEGVTETERWGERTGQGEGRGGEREMEGKR